MGTSAPSPSTYGTSGRCSRSRPCSWPASSAATPGSPTGCGRPTGRCRRRRHPGAAGGLPAGCSTRTGGCCSAVLLGLIGLISGHHRGGRLADLAAVRQPDLVRPQGPAVPPGHLVLRVRLPVHPAGAEPTCSRPCCCRWWWRPGCTTCTAGCACRLRGAAGHRRGPGPPVRAGRGVRPAQGGGLLGGPVRHRLLPARRGADRRLLHRRERDPAGQDRAGRDRASSARCCSWSARPGAARCCRPSASACSCCRPSCSAGVYPAIIQQFVVKPNELAKEAPYMAREITSTRQAYGVSQVQVINYGATSSQSLSRAGQRGGRAAGPAAGRSRRAVAGVPAAPAGQELLPVPRPCSAVDRYPVAGSTLPQDTVIGVRDMGGPPPGQGNWVNTHLVYTHGYGVVAATDDSVQRQRQPGLHRERHPADRRARLRQPRVYFGEQENSYAIVGGPAGGHQEELDYPTRAAASRTTPTTAAAGCRSARRWTGCCTRSSSAS